MCNFVIISWCICKFYRKYTCHDLVHNEVNLYYFVTQQLTWLCLSPSPAALRIQDAKPSFEKYHVAFQKPVQHNTRQRSSTVKLLLLHPLNGLFSGTTWVSRHQKGKPFCILLEQGMTGWQWHQLDHMQIICTSLQTDNHASTSPLSFYSLDAIPAAKLIASKHWRSKLW